MAARKGGLDMTLRVPLPPSGFDDLSADEKVEYVQSLWDRLAASDEQISVPEWHRPVVRERLAEHSDNLARWSEVRNEIERNFLR